MTLTNQQIEALADLLRHLAAVRHLDLQPIVTANALQDAFPDMALTTITAGRVLTCITESGSHESVGENEGETTNG